MLLASGVRHRFIKSSAAGVFAQHDALTWKVVRGRFEESEPSELGLFIMKSQKDWLSKLDDSERQEFVNSLFSILESAGVSSFEQLGADRLRTLSGIRNSMKKMPKEKRKEMNRIIGELLLSGGETAWDTLKKEDGGNNSQ